MTEPDLLVGKIVAGRYQITRQLGAGAMGAVYQATQLSMDRRVALKLIHPHIAASAEVAARFEREMRATSRIEHPNTIQVFDYGADEAGQLFLAMEFLEGRPLSALIEELGRVPLPRLVHIASQVVRALGAAHAEGITHRDLKPDNIMLVDRYDEHDVVKVLDFGIARFIDGDERRTRMTAEGAVVGTPIYMSPEQAKGQTVGATSDFYSLGVMLYEMAVGRPPFIAPTVAGLLVAHAIDTPPPPSTIAPLSPKLEALILALLAKTPSELGRRAPRCWPAWTRRCTKTAALAATGVAPAVRSVSSTAFAATGAVPAAVVPPPKSKPVGNALLRFALVGFALFGLVGATIFKLSGKSATATARARLDALLLAGGDPLAPSECRTDALPVVEHLTKVAAWLEGSTVGKPRPQDQDALTLLSANPERSAEHWALLSRALLVNGRSPDGSGGASAAARQALTLCPRFAWAENLVGNAEQRGQHFDEASAAYQRALDLAPDYLAPRFNLGLLALRANKLDAALAAFDFVLQKDPLRPGVHLARGQTHLLLGQTAPAVDDLEQAVLRQPDSAEAWRLLGQAHEKEGQAIAANEAFCKAKTLGATVGDACHN